jgi:hypothetical protein
MKNIVGIAKIFIAPRLGKQYQLDCTFDRIVNTVWTLFNSSVDTDFLDSRLLATPEELEEMGFTEPSGESLSKNRQFLEEMRRGGYRAFGVSFEDLRMGEPSEEMCDRIHQALGISFEELGQLVTQAQRLNSGIHLHPKPNSVLGEPSCKSSAHSCDIRCAVNPQGPCDGCKDYEKA